MWQFFSERKQNYYMELLFIEITEVQEVSKHGERSLFAEESNTWSVTYRTWTFIPWKCYFQAKYQEFWVYIPLMSHRLRFWISHAVSGHSQLLILHYYYHAGMYIFFIIL